jgi:hypothetical protein
LERKRDRKEQVRERETHGSKAGRFKNRRLIAVPAQSKIARARSGRPVNQDKGKGGKNTEDLETIRAAEKWKNSLVNFQS